MVGDLKIQLNSMKLMENKQMYNAYKLPASSCNSNSLVGELEKSVNGHCVPRFSIFKPYSQDKVDTLKHCFIKKMHLKRQDLPAQICADDGLVYQTVYDSRIPQGEDSFEVIISFQQHTYGRFAVIRVSDESKRRKF